MPDKKRVSIRSLAEDLGLSPATVSLVLSGRAENLRISPETQNLVREKAAALGYVPRKPRKTDKPAERLWKLPRFCILFPIFDYKDDKGDIEDAAGIQRIYTTFLQLQQTTQLQFDFVVKPYFSERISDVMEYISGDFYDGLFFTGLCDADLAYLEKQKLDVPVILFNRNSNRFDSVGVDEYVSGQIAAEHFFRKGHTVVGAVLPDLVSQNYSLKRSGFVDYFLKQGVPRKNICVSYGSRDRSGGIQATRELLQQTPQPTAVFCIDDAMVTGMYYAINEAGLTIPEDIEIVASGNHKWASNLIPSVTSIAPPIKECVLDCVKLFLKAMNESGEEKDAALTHSQYQHIVHLVYRKSSPAVEQPAASEAIANDMLLRKTDRETE